MTYATGVGACSIEKAKSANNKLGKKESRQSIETFRKDFYI